MPRPNEAAPHAGYRYELSIIQADFSLTQVLERSVSGRVFLEEVIRENLDIGRPAQVQLIFGRRVLKTTPGRFRTRVITEASCLRCTSITNQPASSSTTRKVAPCGFANHD